MGEVRPSHQASTKPCKAASCTADIATRQLTELQLLINSHIPFHSQEWLSSYLTRSHDAGQQQRWLSIGVDTAMPVGSHAY